MLSLTKIFYFEMAHAIHGYPGPCKNIHGHSYELQVTDSSVHNHHHHIPAPGFLIDFKEIKKLVTATVIDYFDHKIILSDNYLIENPSFLTFENLVSWQAEPGAENMLLFIQNKLSDKLPHEINLQYLKLFETKDSYAEWKTENAITNCWFCFKITEVYNSKNYDYVF